jgi:hypothetical protein
MLAAEHFFWGVMKNTGTELHNMALSHIIVWDYPVAFSTTFKPQRV